MTSASLLLMGAAVFAAPRISADLKLIERLGPDAYEDEPYDAPYLAVFERGDYLLAYVSGDHSSGVDSAVAKTIRHAFERFKPRAVVVEGLKAGDAKDAQERVAQAERFAEGAPESFPENYYPIHLAVRRGLPFAGGEPTLKDKLRALAPHGYRAEDVLGLGVAAQVGYMNSREPQTAEGLARTLDRMLQHDGEELGLKGWSWAAFERWYQERGGVGKEAHELTAYDARPVDGPKANFIQRVAARLELAREETVVRQIEAMLRTHKRVLVVYGSGHLVRQRPVWRKALGPSKDSKPY